VTVLAIPLRLAAQEARTYIVLYSFTGGADGAQPFAGLVRDGAGNFDGTTFFGGDLSGCFHGSGCGVVFKLDRTGKETALHTFTGVRTEGFLRCGWFGTTRATSTALPSTAAT
jgi:hypothetical protein